MVELISVDWIDRNWHAMPKFGHKGFRFDMFSEGRKLWSNSMNGWNLLSTIVFEHDRHSLLVDSFVSIV